MTALIESAGMLSGPVMAVLVAAAKGTILIAAAAVLALLLRRRSAAVRHGVWVGAIIGNLVLLAATPIVPTLAIELPAGLPTFAIELPPALPTFGPTTSGDRAPDAGSMSATGAVGARGVIADLADAASVLSSSAVSGPAGASDPMQHTGTAPSATATAQNQRASISAITVLSIVWLAGLLAVLVRFAIGTAVVARVARRSMRVEDGSWLSLVQRTAGQLDIGRPLTLMRGSELEVPVTWGMIYPVVLLPEEAAEWPEERRRFVLLHEMAHVKRQDALTQFAAQVATAVFWFNPLVWYAAHRMRVEREHACDDCVLQHGTRASEYADGLLDMVRRIGQRRGAAGPAFAALAMARRGELEGRMLAILDPATPRRTPGRFAVAGVVAGITALSLSIAAIRPAVAAEQAVPPMMAEAERSASAPTQATSAESWDGASNDGALTDASSSPLGDRAPDGGGLADASLAATALRDSAPGGRGLAAASLTAAALRDSAQQLARTARVAAAAALDTPRTPRVPRAAALDTPRTRWAAEFGSRVLYDCTDAELAGNGTSIMVHTDGEKNSRNLSEVRSYGGGVCTHAIMTGDVRFTEALDDVAAVGPGARAYFVERRRSGERVLMIRGGADGAQQRSYFVNGRPEPVEDSRAWLAESIRWMLLKAGFGAEQRVKSLIEGGGVDAVLAEVARINSDGVRRRYYELLLDHEPRLSTGEADRVLRHAARHIRSSGDLRAVSMKALAFPVSPEAIGGMTAAIESDGDLRAVLTKSLEQPGTEMLLTVLRGVQSMSSAGDKSAVLVRAAPAAIADRTTRREFLAATATVSSSGDMERVLRAAIPHAPREGAAVRELIEATKRVASEGDRARVLIAIARADLLVDANTRESFAGAARTIESDGDYRRVIEALLR